MKLTYERTMEGRMEGKKMAGRLRMMLLDWMFDKKSKFNYQDVQEVAQG